MDEKGVSPLIAAVLLVAFTMTVAAILATWSSSFVRSKTKEAGKRQMETSFCNRLNLRVESVEYKSSEDTITTLLWNTGEGNLTNFKINVYYSSTNLTSHSPSNANKSIAPGDFVTLDVDDVTKPPKKIGINSFAEKCPGMQPLYMCTYSDGRFIC